MTWNCLAESAGQPAVPLGHCWAALLGAGVGGRWHCRDSAPFLYPAPLFCIGRRLLWRRILKIGAEWIVDGCEKLSLSEVECGEPRNVTLVHC